MDKILILVAGMPGAGKTRFANYLEGELDIPLICKDRLKEIIWDKIHYDSQIRAESQKYGGLAYDLTFHFCDTLMKRGLPLICESNFIEPCGDTFGGMADKYGYKVITVLFDGDVEVIHKHFVERDVTSERHPGLVSNNYFSDFEVFSKGVQPCRDFSYGDLLITVDATDFANVSYTDIVKQIKAYATNHNKESNL